jgi:ubiquinone/menaquinone biosynthesis C-methylase UbiE
MCPQERAQADDGASGHIPYTIGSHPTEQQRLEQRTAARSGAFFPPHRRSGMRLLDYGCGVRSITTGLAEAVAPGEVIGIDRQYLLLVEASHR